MSSTTTLAPVCTACQAAAEPAGPPPTIARSNRCVTRYISLRSSSSMDYPTVTDANRNSRISRRAGNGARTSSIRGRRRCGWVGTFAAGTFGDHPVADSCDQVRPAWAGTVDDRARGAQIQTEARRGIRGGQGRRAQRTVARAPQEGPGRDRRRRVPRDRPARPRGQRARDRRGGRHREAEDLSALHRQVRPVPGHRRAAARHAVGRDLPGHQPDHRFGPRGHQAEHRAVRLPRRRPPQRGAVRAAGPIPRAGRGHHACRQRGPRDHAGDGGVVQQRTARDGTRPRRDRTGRLRHLRDRGLSHRLVAGTGPGQSPADAAGQVHRASDAPS